MISKPDLLDRASRHSEQWAGFGPVSVGITYMLNNAISDNAVGDRACANYFEADAEFEGGG